MFDEGADKLFDVFDQKAELAQSTSSSAPAKGASNKRKEVQPVSKPVVKKNKIDAAPKAILTDSFELQSTREVKVVPTISEKDLPSTANDALVGLSHQIRHNVALPPSYNYVPLGMHVAPTVPARTYPFKLDPFQETSIACIQRNESVLVSAHTSAGKTVVAEYAIAQCLRDHQRVIYTSPIKALSNQKYRELESEFHDVGLMTGDVSISPQASCLVMTTEVLRSMLYRGSEVLREVAWVIFDEIHYMRDKERGVVWEESLILLPHQVRHVFLSATIPNAMEFAEWICKLHDQPCHIVYTDFRPTPLQHYLFPAGSEGIHLVVDENGHFREDNFERAISTITDRQKEREAEIEPGGSGKGLKGKFKRDKSTEGPSDVYKIINMLMVKNYHPVIIFSFSKRECENLALQLSKLDFCEEEEKKSVAEIYENAVTSLSSDDRNLPQIEHIFPLLKRGIGIHHSGLLPVLKEVIEILFQEGLIKVLFATETFSIGLNMPAKTVVFTSVQKFDGKDFRWVSSGEYIQMSGRAGRRGLDDRGIVIMMLDAKMEPSVAKDMVKGEADRLNSAFHLSYNMILNLMRVEVMSPEVLLERCFKQFQNTMNVPNVEADILKLEAERASIIIPDEPLVEEYYNLQQQHEKFKADMRKIVHHPSYILPYILPGRLARIKVKDADFGWSAIVNYQKKSSKQKSDSNPEIIVDVVLRCKAGGDKDQFLPCPEGEKGEMIVVPLTLNSFESFSSIRIYLPKDLKTSENRLSVRKTMLEIFKRFPDGVPLLDPVADMKITDKSFKMLVQRIELVEAKLFSNPLNDDPNLPALLKSFGKKMELGQTLKETRKELQNAVNIIQMDELKCRKRVLRRLGYTTQADVIDVKGRVACEISTGDELLLTELIFNGVFNDLNVAQSVALLSCFVFQEKSDHQPKLTAELSGPLQVLQETARRLAQVYKECKLEVDEDEYVTSFRPELMDVTHAWCSGAKFSQVCKMTDVFEGSLIRAFRRLEELLRQMAAAAKSIGNAELESKFGEGVTKIKRDIIFAASLYL